MTRPANPRERDYAANFREAMARVAALPASERSAVANRPGVTPPSTPTLGKRTA